MHTLLMIVLFLVFLSSAIGMAMAGYAFFQREFPLLAVSRRLPDSLMACTVVAVLGGLIGPLAFLIGFLLFGGFKHRFAVPFTDPWKGDHEARVDAIMEDPMLMYISRDRIEDLVERIDNGTFKV